MVSKGRNSITFDEITSKISDASLVYHYLGISELPCFIKSPLRNDKKPSFGLYSIDGNRVYYTDLATKERGGIYDLLSKLWQCSTNEVLTRIQKDLLNSNNKTNVNRLNFSNPKKISNKKNIKLDIKIREWRQYDIDYWKSYGVSLEWLKYADIYPISHKIITKDGQKYIFCTDKLAYAFIEYKEDNTTIKIYQPLNKEGYKWSNTHDRSVISLWTKVPKTGDRIVICASLKDALCFWSNTGIPALALQGEGYGMSKTAIEDLKNRYNRIYILFDNDKAGIDDSRKLAELTGFINLTLPDFPEGKDISDLMKYKGKEIFIKVIKDLLEPQNNKGELLEDNDCPF